MNRYALAGQLGTSMGRLLKSYSRKRSLDAAVSSYGNKKARVKARFIKRGGKKYRKRVSKTSKTSKCAKICRSIVKRELKKEENVGTYLKNYAGFLKQPPNQPNSMTETADVGVYWQSPVGLSWALMKRLDFFTPTAIMDVASVLFNGKAAALDPILTGNFPKLSDLKFTVYTAIATITFRNCTENTVQLTLFEATPKELEEEDFGTDWLNSLQSTNMSQVGGVTATPFTHGQSPLQIKGLWKRYRMTEKTRTLRPGEMFSHVVSMPKNYLFNGVNYYDANVIAKYARFSKQVWYKYRSLIQPSVYSEGGNKVLSAYKPFLKRALDNEANESAGLVVEVKEKYRISAPKNTPDDKKVDAYCLFNAYDGSIRTHENNFEIAPSYSLTYEGFIPS